MQSFSPEEITDTSVKKIEAQLDERAKLITRMWTFYNTVTADDCAGISGQGQRVQYTHKHQSAKVKGGSPPKDYTAVEVLVDFRKAMDSSKFEDAIPLYFSLKRMIGW